jgi:hypothetical protein
MSYHQTTPMEPRPLREAIEQAKRQEDAIHAIFLRFPHLKLAPSQVHELVTKADHVHSPGHHRPGTRGRADKDAHAPHRAAWAL